MDKIKRKTMLTMILSMLFFLLPINEIKAADDFDYGKEKAQSIIHEENYEGNLKDTGEADWYRLDTTSYTAFYTVSLKNVDISGSLYNSNSSDALVFRIYDSDGVLIEDMSAAKGEESTAHIKLRKDEKYYIKLYARYRNAGRYQFVVHVQKDEADTIKDAASIALSKTYTASLLNGKDVDWYKVKLPMRAEYFDVTLQNTDISGGSYDFSDALLLEIYDAEEVMIYSMSAEKGKRQQTEFSLKADKTYYIKIYAKYECSGSYKFNIQKLDDAGDSMRRAQEIQLDKTKIYRMDSATDVDWYKVKCPTAGRYTVTFKNVDIADATCVNDLTMSIYKDNGKKIYTVDVDTGIKILSTFQLQRDSYYFEISSQQGKTGKYKLGIASVD